MMAEGCFLNDGKDTITPIRESPLLSFKKGLTVLRLTGADWAEYGLVRSEGTETRECAEIKTIRKERTASVRKISLKRPAADMSMWAPGIGGGFEDSKRVK